jgi:ribosome-associated protein
MNKPLLHASILAAAELSFSRSGGPGGQNVNKVSTKVTLHLALSQLEGLSATEMERLRVVLKGRLSGETCGELVLQCSEERSQQANRQIALARAEALIVAAARIPRRRRPTRPGRAARERRLEAKHRRGRLKAMRTNNLTC